MSLPLRRYAPLTLNHELGTDKSYALACEGPEAVEFRFRRSNFHTNIHFGHASRRILIDA